VVEIARDTQSLLTRVDCTSSRIARGSPYIVYTVYTVLFTVTVQYVESTLWCVTASAVRCQRAIISPHKQHDKSVSQKITRYWRYITRCFPYLSTPSLSEHPRWIPAPEANHAGRYGRSTFKRSNCSKQQSHELKKRLYHSV
jgi:hypothetical protein